MLNTESNTMSGRKIIRRVRKEDSKEKVKNDLKAHIEVKFDDGLTIKNLFKFILDLSINKKKKNSKNIYIIFTKEIISFHHKLEDVEKEYEPLNVYFKIDQYLLTKHIFKSSVPAYVMGFDIKELSSTINLCKKGDFFMIEKTPISQRITTRNSPEDNSLMQQIELDDYIPFEEPVYNINRTKPICVVTGDKFSDLCHNFRETPNDIINIDIFKNGILFASTNSDTNSDTIISGRVRAIGTINNDEKLASCYTYKLNIIKLQKIKKCCSSSNVLIYYERDDRGIVKPLKLIYSLGYIGEITIYIGIKEH